MAPTQAMSPEQKHLCNQAVRHCFAIYRRQNSEREGRAKRGVLAAYLARVLGEENGKAAYADLIQEHCGDADKWFRELPQAWAAALLLKSPIRPAF